MQYRAEDIMPIAEELMDYMRCYCHQARIAGSLRRGAKAVKDIEIVVEPMTEAQVDLFGDLVGQLSLLDPQLVKLVADGILSQPIKDGERYKQFEVLGRKHRIKLDLFIVRPPAQWGWIFLLRTGPASFNKRLVTKRRKGGLMPSHITARDGALWVNDELEPTPTERSVFKLFGMEYLEPGERQ